MGHVLDFLFLALRDEKNDFKIQGMESFWVKYTGPLKAEARRAGGYNAVLSEYPV